MSCRIHLLLTALLVALPQAGSAETIADPTDPAALPAPSGDLALEGLFVDGPETAAAAGEAANLPPADDLLAAYLARQGGRARVLEVQTLRLRGTIEAAGRGEPQPFILSRKRPDRFRLMLRGPQGAVHIGFDGRSAWRGLEQAEGGWLNLELTEADRDAIRRMAAFDAPLYDALDEPGRRRLIGRAETFAGPAWVFEVVRPDGRGFERIFVHTGTLVEVRTESWRGSAVEQPVHVQQLGAYRHIEPLWLPTEITTVSVEAAAGTGPSRMLIESILINPGLFDQYFEVPEGLAHAHQP